MNAMILAAGEGTRLRPHTLQLPKPAIPFLGTPLLTYSLGLLEAWNLNKIIFNSFHLPEKLEACVQNICPIINKELGRNVLISEEAPTILGSGGALYQAQNLLQDPQPFWFANGDEVILPHTLDSLSGIRKRHSLDNALATLLVCDHPLLGQKFNALISDGAGNFQGVRKAPFQKSAHDHHYIGVMILSPRVFKYTQAGVSNILHDVLLKAVTMGEHCKIAHLDCQWFETGNERDFLLAANECVNILSHKRPGHEFLQNHLRRFAPDYTLGPVTRVL